MYKGNSKWDIFIFSVPLTSVSKLSSRSVTWHPLNSWSPESSCQGRDQCTSSWRSPVGSLTLEMRCTGEDRKTCALRYAHKVKGSWEGGGAQAWLVRSYWSAVFCFPVCILQRMLKTGKYSKCSLYKRKLGIDLVTVHKYFTWERDF